MQEALGGMTAIAAAFFRRGVPDAGKLLGCRIPCSFRFLWLNCIPGQMVS
jgi:hypothetical protein